MPVDFPPELALKEFVGPTTRHIRRVEIYESDGETRWEKDTQLRLKGGTVSVDYDRDERRMLDSLVLANDDGALLNAPEEFWYDKIIKVFRGVRINQPKRMPKVVIISDPTGDATLAPSFRDAIEAAGFTNVTVNTLASTWEHIMNFDVIVGLGAASTQQIALLKRAYDEGKSLFVQDVDAGAWIATQFATETATISSGSTVTPLATSPHPVSKGWAPFSYINPGSRRNAARNPQAVGQSDTWTVPNFGRRAVTGATETGQLLTGASTALIATNLIRNPIFETGTTDYGSLRVAMTRDNTWADEGTYSLKLSAQDNTSSADSYATTGIGTALDTGGGMTFFTAGKQYTIQATARVKGKHHGILHGRRGRIIAFTKAPADAGYTEYLGEQFPNEPGTYRPSLTFTVPTGHTQAFFRLMNGAAAFTRTNYCTNPSFETSQTAGWVTAANISIGLNSSDTDFRTGTKSAYIWFQTSVLASTYVYTQSAIPSTGAGKWIYVGVDLATHEGGFGSITLEGRTSSTGSGNAVISQLEDIVLTGNRQRFVAKMQVPTGVTIAHLRAVIRGYGNAEHTIVPTSGTTWSIDACDMGIADTEEDATEFAGKYMDGSLADNDEWIYAWTGTANASSSTAIARQEIWWDNVTIVEGPKPRQFSYGTRWRNLITAPRDAGHGWITNGATGIQSFISTGGPKNVGYKEFRLNTSTTSGSSLGLRTSPTGASAFRINGGEKYTFSAYSYMQAATTNGTAQVGIAVEWLSEAGTVLAESNTLTWCARATWERVSRTYTAPNNAARASVRMFYTASGGFKAGTVIQVSANMVERGDELREYFEGSRAYSDNAMDRRLTVAGANGSTSTLTESISPTAKTPFSWFTNFVRWVVKNPRTGNAGVDVWWAHETAFKQPLTGAVGDKAVISVWARSSVATTFTLKTEIYTAGGAVAGSRGAVSVVAQPNTWYKLQSATGSASQAFTSAGWYLESSAPQDTDVATDITALLIEKNTVGDYFDGSMPDTTRLANNWEAVVNASASLQANASTQAYSVNDPSFTPIALAQDLIVDSSSNLSLVSAFEEPNRGGRAVALTVPMDFTMYDQPGLRGMLSSAFKWLDTIEAVTEWEVQIGEFMIDRITEAHFPYDMTVTGRDYTKKCIKSKFLHATQFAAGMPLESLIDSIAGAAGVVKRSLPTTGVVIDREFFFDRGVTRWEALKEIATAYNHEIFFDATGYLTVRPFRDPTTESPLLTIKTGPDGNLATYDKSTSDTEIYNVILVTGESSDAETPPVWAVAKNDNPDSPTAISKIGERVFEYSSSFITTTAQAQALANSYLAIYALEENELGFSALMMPWLEVGDILGFEDPRPAPGDPANFLLTNLSIPLGLGPMSGTGRRVMIVG